MSLHPEECFPAPEETSRVARAAFPKGTLCLHIADALGQIYNDSQFAALFPRRGQPAEAPGRLALATVLQFVEGLSDRQAADAVRGRIDWKCALGLSLTDPGFDHTVLSEFRSRLIEGNAERLRCGTASAPITDARVPFLVGPWPATAHVARSAAPAIRHGFVEHRFPPV